MKLFIALVFVILTLIKEYYSYIHNSYRLSRRNRHFLLHSTNINSNSNSYSSINNKKHCIMKANTLIADNQTYLSFPDAEKLISITSKEDKTVRTKIVPDYEQFDKGKDLWSWWQEKNMADTIMKSAIGSAEPEIEKYFDEYKKYLVMDKANILQANSDFQEALVTGDLIALQAILLKSDDTFYATFNEPVQLGYDNIVNHLSNVTPTNEKCKITNTYLSFQGCLAILSYDLEATSMIESSSKKNSNRYKSSATNLLSSNKLGENKKNKKKRTVKSFVTNIFLKPSNSDKYQLLGHMKSPTEISNESSTMNSLKNIYRDPSKFRKKENSEIPSSLQRLLGGGSMQLGNNGIQGRVIRLNFDDDEDTDSDDDDDDEESDDDDSDDDIEIKVRNVFLDDNGNEMEILDEEDKDDDEDEDDEDDRRVNELENIKQAIKNSLEKLLTGKNIARSARDGVMLLEKQPDRSMQASKIFSGIFNDDDDNNGSLRKKSNLLKGGSNSNLDNSSDEDEDEKLAKDLAFRTSEAVRWLYDRDRLTLNEKRLITKDIIENVGIGGFSRAEIAYCLLIGGMRPGEDDLDDVPRDLSLVDPEDVQDFEDICHQYTG